MNVQRSLTNTIILMKHKYSKELVHVVLLQIQLSISLHFSTVHRFNIPNILLRFNHIFGFLVSEPYADITVPLVPVTLLVRGCCSNPGCLMVGLLDTLGAA